MADGMFTNTYVMRHPWNYWDIDLKGNKIERWTFKVKYLKTQDRGRRSKFWKSDPIYQPNIFYDNKASAEQGNYN